MASPDIPKREGYLKHPEWLNSDIKALGKKGSTLGRVVTEGMPELLFGEEGTIPWYMSLAFGADNMISSMYTPKQLSDLLQIVGEHPSDKTLKSTARYMMEGTGYGGNPADELLERVKLGGGLIADPGNGKRFEVIDASEFKPHRGSISKGEDYGEFFDGIGYTDAIKPASKYDIETPEAHRQRLLLNYRTLMGK